MKQEFVKQFIIKSQRRTFLASPDFDRNKDKVFQKRRHSFQSSNKDDQIWGAGKALANPDYVFALVDKDLSKEESEDRINSILISATIILNIILLVFFTKMILLLPNEPKIVDPVIFTPGTY